MELKMEAVALAANTEENQQQMNNDDEAPNVCKRTQFLFKATAR